MESDLFYNGRAVEHVEWEHSTLESQILGFSFGRITYMEYLTDSLSRPLPLDFYSPLVGQFQRDRLDYVVVSLDGHFGDRIRLLEESGFQFLKQGLLLNRNCLFEEGSRETSAFAASEFHLPKILQMSRSTSGIDQLISKSSQEKLASEWLQRGAGKHPGECLFIAGTQDNIQGFLRGSITRNHSNENLGVFEISVSSSSDNKNPSVVGDLIQIFGHWVKERGGQSICTEIHADQLHLLPILIENGFLAGQLRVSLRWVRRESLQRIAN